MREQWKGSKESWDKIMALGITWKQWAPGEMGTKTFFLITRDGSIKVEVGDWVIKNDDGTFSWDSNEK
jgi:hypothetical protein